MSFLSSELLHLHPPCVRANVRPSLCCWHLSLCPACPEGQPCPVASWDASLYPEGLAAGWSTVRLTWAEYQGSLKQRCWHRNVSPKPDSGCSSVHHYEWSKLALFDFLLQVMKPLWRTRSSLMVTDRFDKFHTEQVCSSSPLPRWALCSLSLGVYWIPKMLRRWLLQMSFFVSAVLQQLFLAGKYMWTGLRGFVLMCGVRWGHVLRGVSNVSPDHEGPVIFGWKWKIQT